jgi:hypothetical protein
MLCILSSDLAIAYQKSVLLRAEHRYSPSQDISAWVLRICRYKSSFAALSFWGVADPTKVKWNSKPSVAVFEGVLFECRCIWGCSLIRNSKRRRKVPGSLRPTWVLMPHLSSGQPRLVIWSNSLPPRYTQTRPSLLINHTFTIRIDLILERCKVLNVT